VAPQLKSAPAAPAVGPGSDDPFTFKSSLGDITVPSLSVAPKPNALAVAAAKRRGQMDEIVAMLTEAAASPEAWELLTTIPNEELEDFYTQWGRHSGITPGESRAS
jgi:hypothetical protein